MRGIKELTDLTTQYLKLADPLVVKLLTAVFCGNSLPLPSPIFMFLVSSSSGGKSQLLSCFEFNRKAVYCDDASPSAFISGFKNNTGYRGMLFEAEIGTNFIIKDWTTWMSKPQDVQAQLHSIIRVIFDGYMYKRTGVDGGVDATGKPPLAWKGHVGMIIGTTGAMNQDREKNAALGERALLYMMPQQEDREGSTFYALENRLVQANMQSVLQPAYKEYCDSLMASYPDKVEDLPKMSSEFNMKLAKLSSWVTLAASAVEREQFSRERYVKGLIQATQPYRLAFSLQDVATSLMMINKHDGFGAVLLPEDEKLITKMALDTIPLNRLMIAEALTSHMSADSTKLAQILGLSKETVERVCEDLLIHKTIDVVEDKVMRRRIWSLKKDFREIISEYRNIEMTDNVLVTENPVFDI